MSAKSRKVESTVGVKIIGKPELWRLDFTLKDMPIESATPAEGSVKINLRLYRLSRERLGVELSAQVEDIPSLHVNATYRAMFELEQPPESDREVENAVRNIGVQLGPRVLYPFVREVISDVTLRAGLSPFILPIVNLDELLKPEAIQVPSFPAERKSVERGAKPTRKAKKKAKPKRKSKAKPKS